MIKKINILELKELNRFVLETYGMDFTKFSLAAYRRRLIQACHHLEMNSIEALLNSLKSPDFFELFLKEMVVEVTEMFRDPSFWRRLKLELKERYQNTSRLRIWIAGGSSGQELLSLLILLKEINFFDKTKVTTTEIHSKVFETVKKLKYPIKSLEITRSNFERLEFNNSIEDFYTIENDTVTFEKSLLNNVVFNTHLLDSNELLADKFDLILCRNVLLYYNQNTQKKIIEKFSKSLLSKGKLAIGIKEALVNLNSQRLFSILSDEEKIYEKRYLADNPSLIS
jgi:chemotaxis protein methyltransferase CheR